jgi:guanyl-specific ribonuclease Sa
MPIRDRIIWGLGNPFSDPRLIGLDVYVKSIRRGRLPLNVTGGGIFGNLMQDLPVKPYGYYREYDVEPSVGGKDRGKLRLVVGNNGEVYITGNHYRDFRQIINMPT